MHLNRVLIKIKIKTQCSIRSIHYRIVYNDADKNWVTTNPGILFLESTTRTNTGMVGRFLGILGVFNPGIFTALYLGLADFVLLTMAGSWFP